MVARQKIHAGLSHAGKTATVICEDNTIHRYKTNATGKRALTRLTPKDDDPHARNETGRYRRGRAGGDAAILSQWLAGDPDRLSASLVQFVGDPAYGLGQLRQDLERFAFLLGGSEGEQLFGP